MAEKDTSFSPKEAIIVGESQESSFYWQIKKRCIENLFSFFVDPSDKILDFGCGTSFLVQDLAAEYPSYLGVDRLDAALNQAKLRLGNDKLLLKGGLDEVINSELGTCDVEPCWIHGGAYAGLDHS